MVMHQKVRVPMDGKTNIIIKISGVCLFDIIF